MGQVTVTKTIQFTPAQAAFIADLSARYGRSQRAILSDALLLLESAIQDTPTAIKDVSRRVSDNYPKVGVYNG